MPCLLKQLSRFHPHIAMRLNFPGIALINRVARLDNLRRRTDLSIPLQAKRSRILLNFVGRERHNNQIVGIARPPLVTYPRPPREILNGSIRRVSLNQLPASPRSQRRLALQQFQRRHRGTRVMDPVISLVLSRDSKTSYAKEASRETLHIQSVYPKNGEL